MSESEEKSQRSEEQQQEEENSEQEGDNSGQQQDEDEERSEQEEQDQEDQQQNSQQEQGSGDQQQQQDENQEEQSEYKLPSFPASFVEPAIDKMSIQYISGQLNSLQFTVDSFINSLSSQGGSGNYKQTYTSMSTGQGFYQSNLPLNSIGFTKAQPKPKQKVHIKDFQIQVDMQPQIVIQSVNKTPSIEQRSSSYVINSQSQNYLSRLSETKKSDINRFQRKQQDLIDWDKRNKEIDEAMRVFKKQY